MDDIKNEQTFTNSPQTSLTGSPVTQINEQNSGHSESKFLNKKKALVGLVVLVILVLSGVFLFSLIRSSNTGVKENPISASDLPPDLLLATVSGEEILISSLNEFAVENLGPRKLNSETLRSMLDLMIERKILDKQAEAENINIIPPDGRKNENYYKLLRERLIQGEVASVEVINIGWWLPAFEYYEQTPLSEQQRLEQEQASVDIEQKFISNVPTEEILQYIYKTYPAIAQSLSINGTKYEGQGSINSDQFIRKHELNEDLMYFPRYQVMFNLEEGQVERNIWEDGSGADVVKVIRVNRGTGQSYNEWLTKLIQTEVIYNQEALDSL